MKSPPSSSMFGAGDKMREWGIGCGPGFGEVDVTIIAMDGDSIVT